MAKKKIKSSETTTADLRSMLLETIQGVKAGDIDHKQGATIASLSKAVIASAKLDFDVFRFHETAKVDDGQKLKSISLEG